MHLRPATADDVDAVVALVQSAYRGESSRAGWTTEADLLDGQRTDADEVRGLLSHLILAVGDGADDREVIGCCVLVPGEVSAHFGMFAVRPDRQGARIGSTLLREAERVAALAGCTRVDMTVLTVRTDVLAFYERRGYAPTGATLPFPHTDARFGLPRVADLVFAVLAKDL